MTKLQYIILFTKENISKEIFKEKVINLSYKAEYNQY